VILYWKIFAFPVLFESVFGNKIEKFLTAELISDFSENTTFDFVLFYQKLINTISPEFSPTLLFCIEYPLTPNPIMHMMNEISYL